MFIWELSKENNGIETAVMRYEVVSVFAAVFCDEELIAGACKLTGWVTRGLGKSNYRILIKYRCNTTRFVSVVLFYRKHSTKIRVKLLWPTVP